jgi:sortase A
VSAVKRFATRLVGALLLTAGVLALTHVAYDIWGTGASTRSAQHRLMSDLAPTPSAAVETRTPVVPSGTQKPAAPMPGHALAVLRIPRLGPSWTWAVVEGVERRYLADGPGHYPGTALPGQAGNFAVAGHQVTHGSPFARLGDMKPGDQILVDYRGRRYTYVVDSTRVVDPSDTAVVLPVPDVPHATPSKRLITLTTCYPPLRSTERFIVFGHLDSTRAL